MPRRRRSQIDNSQEPLRDDRASAHTQRLPFDLESLSDMPLDELRVFWAKHMGRRECPTVKKVLVRELAWSVQERIYGGLDLETKRLLDAAVRKAHVRRLDPKKQNANSDNDQRPPLRRKRSITRGWGRGGERSAAGGSSGLVTGARFIRTWPPDSRTMHEVLVLENGKRFKYKDKAYGSLSEVARAITGTRWSGPRFFGIATRCGDTGHA